MASPLTILVMDDDSHERLTLCDHLTAVGYRVASATTSDQGDEILKRLRPDLLLLDLMLPRVNPGRFLEKIKLMLPEMRIIVISGVGGPALKSLCELLGADEYMRRPIAMNRLLDAIGRWLPRASDPRPNPAALSLPVEYPLSHVG